MQTEAASASAIACFRKPTSGPFWFARHHDLEGLYSFLLSSSLDLRRFLRVRVFAGIVCRSIRPNGTYTRPALLPHRVVS